MLGFLQRNDAIGRGQVRFGHLPGKTDRIADLNSTLIQTCMGMRAHRTEIVYTDLQRKRRESAAQSSACSFASELNNSSANRLL